MDVKQRQPILKRLQGKAAKNESNPECAKASFWQIAFMRLLVGLGVIGAALGAIALALRGLRRAVRRS